MMTDEAYKDMILAHDKHIDKLTSSMEHIASSVIATHGKINDVIDVISQQHVLMEKISNLDVRVTKLETHESKVIGLIISTVIVAGLSLILIKGA
jgi:hypothetical protein